MGKGRFEKETTCAKVHKENNSTWKVFIRQEMGDLRKETSTPMKSPRRVSLRGEGKQSNNIPYMRLVLVIFDAPEGPCGPMAPPGPGIRKELLCEFWAHFPAIFTSPSTWTVISSAVCPPSLQMALSAWILCVHPLCTLTVP